MKPVSRYLAIGVIEHDALIADTSTARLIRLEVTSATEPTTPCYVDLEHLEATPDSDPARPELAQVKALHAVSRPPKPRLIDRVLQSLRASESIPPLNLPGPSVAYGRFDGLVPSCCVIALNTPTLAIDRAATPNLGFSWNGVNHHIPLTQGLTEMLHPSGPITHPRQWKLVRKAAPEFAVLAFTTPHEGYCKKWVVSLY
ncbi:MAG: hypothetical protein ACYDHP_06810 [Ferrimicrobium sp.]